MFVPLTWIFYQNFRVYLQINICLLNNRKKKLFYSELRKFVVRVTLSLKNIFWLCFIYLYILKDLYKNAVYTGIGRLYFNGTRDPDGSWTYSFKSCIEQFFEYIDNTFVDVILGSCYKTLNKQMHVFYNFNNLLDLTFYYDEAWVRLSNYVNNRK